MSAVESTFEGALGPDGIRRYHTKCKIRVDSHNAGSGDHVAPIPIMEDISSVQLGKTLKGIGQANIRVVASQNYLNLIFPNDYINIYFDIGDGSGWTRTFFGLVDRVEEQYQVSQNGQPQTYYFITCSDFMKAFQKINIYFNPQLINREDLDGADYATFNIGGMELATKGLEYSGSPPDLVQNVVTTLLGFGTQCILPPSYDPQLKGTLRQRRAEYAQGKLSEDTRRAIQDAGSYEKFRNEVMKEAENDALVNTVMEADESDALSVFKNLSESELSETTQNEFERKMINKLQAGRETQTSFSRAQFDILEGTIDKNVNLLDVIDTFTFIERRAMDGHTGGKTIWQKEGTLHKLLTNVSHENVNELFFDLRPLSPDLYQQNGLSLEPVAGTYAREPDDVSGNLAEDGSRTGITYVPAIVMREYPFSTIEALDLRDVDLTFTRTDPGNTTERDISLDIMHFGAIFSSQRPGGESNAGRHIVTLPKSINPEDLNADGTTDGKGIKHIDVAEVKEAEIMRSQLGRSDHEHFNLLEVTSSDLIGQNAKFFMSDLLPIVTPIHIMRHGLRVRSLQTRFARYGLSFPSQQPPEEEEDKADESEEEAKEEEMGPVKAGDVTIPTVPDANYRDASSTKSWGYRQIGDNPWIFHHGLDIVPPSDQLGKEAESVPIYAIADGEIMVSGPPGIYDLYGNCILIRHKFEGFNHPIYTYYAHLSKRTKGWLLGAKKDTKSNRSKYAAKGAPGIGQQTLTKEPIKVKKGDIIGYMGATGTKNPNKRHHLHFEVDLTFPPNVGDSWDATPTKDVSSKPSTPSRFDETGKNPGAGQRSVNPYAFFKQIHGIDLNEAFNNPLDDDDEAVEDDPLHEAGKDEDHKSKEDAGVEEPEESTGTKVRGAVDSTLTRKQLIRWALLQDHWYQHNIEYLSGRIDMRGAPEIRVGYRLDLVDRNMSFYIEGVNHMWQYPSNMQTTLQVTRGQPNNPYPLYVAPPLERFGSPKKQRKLSKSRLATYFLTPDPVAVRRSLMLSKKQKGLKYSEAPGILSGLGPIQNNEIDSVPATGLEEGVHERYNEKVHVANSPEMLKILADEAFEETKTPDEKEKDKYNISDSAGGIEGQTTPGTTDLGGTGGGGISGGIG